MRTSIFTGLIYIAWAINPREFDALSHSIKDATLIWLVFWMSFAFDLIEFLNKKK